jgi:DNA polymerase III alpha subunit
MFLESTRILSKSTKRISWCWKLIWRNSGKILNIGENQAEEALIWWKQFGADFYLEIMRHNQEDENRVNKTLIEFAQKHEVKLIASNNIIKTRRC